MVNDVILMVDEFNNKRRMNMSREKSGKQHVEPYTSSGTSEVLSHPGGGWSCGGHWFTTAEDLLMFQELSHVVAEVLKVALAGNVVHASDADAG